MVRKSSVSPFLVPLKHFTALILVDETPLVIGNC